MARSALLVAAMALVVCAIAAQAECIDFTEEDLESDDSAWALYERWAVHNKVARDPAEKIRRFPVFKENARLILHMNQQGDARYRNIVGLNVFGDMTKEEITNYVGNGFIPDEWMEEESTNYYPTGFSSSDIPDDMPSRVSVAPPYPVNKKIFKTLIS